MMNILMIIGVCGCVSLCHAAEKIKILPGGDDTTNIQSAIDKCFLAGGGEVALSPGEYWVKGLRLRSRTTLRLLAGVKLRASRNPADYEGVVAADMVEPMKSGEFDSDDQFVQTCTNSWNNGVIRIFKAHDVSIIGEVGSEIDGRNCYNPHGEEGFRGPHGISVHFSTNLIFRGYTIRDTGNWAHRICLSSDVKVDGVTILGGHDGVDFHACDRITVENCRIRSGDDCIAGFDNSDMLVRNCSLNAACSIFRIGGRNILAENLAVTGPAEYCHRRSLSLEDKISGVNPTEYGRRDMLSFFTYYGNPRARFVPGNIVFRNITVNGVDRFMHYNFSGNETWQKGAALSDVTFENVVAQGIAYSLTAYAKDGVPLTMNFRNCRFVFRDFVGEFIKGANIGVLNAGCLEVHRLNGPFLRIWGDNVPIFDVKGLTGVKSDVAKSVIPFNVRSI